MMRRTITLALLCMFFVPGSAPSADPQGKPNARKTASQDSAAGRSKREKEKSDPSKQKKTESILSGSHPVVDATQNLGGAEGAVAHGNRASKNPGVPKPSKPPTTIEDLARQAHENGRARIRPQTIPAQQPADHRYAEENSEGALPDLKIVQWEETQDVSGRQHGLQPLPRTAP